ncbi:MAG: hypothetical protein ACI9HK_006289, partial [Pirellulaceae bacterium]
MEKQGQHPLAKAILGGGSHDCFPNANRPPNRKAFGTRPNPVKITLGVVMADE